MNEFDDLDLALLLVLLRRHSAEVDKSRRECRKYSPNPIPPALMREAARGDKLIAAVAAELHRRKA